MASRERRQAAWTRSRRLRRPAEFRAVAHAGRRASWRLAAGSLAMTAMWSVATAEQAGVRVGIAISRRFARRAVDRSAVKRIVREAARARIAALEVVAAAKGLRVDVVVRMQAARSEALSFSRWRQALRADAEQLFDALASRLDRTAAGDAVGEPVGADA